MTPEAIACQQIDAQLLACGWVVQNSGPSISQPAAAFFCAMRHSIRMGSVHRTETLAASQGAVRSCRDHRAV